MGLQLKILDKTGVVIASAAGEGGVTLVYPVKYCKGDKIIFTGGKPGYYYLRLKDTIAPGFVYVANYAEISVPFGRMERMCCSLRALKSLMNIVNAETAEPSQIAARRNLALRASRSVYVCGLLTTWRSAYTDTTCAFTQE